MQFIIEELCLFSLDFIFYFLLTYASKHINLILQFTAPHQVTITSWLSDHVAKSTWSTFNAKQHIRAKSYGLLSTVCRLGLYLTFYFVIAAKWIGFIFIASWSTVVHWKL